MSKMIELKEWATIPEAARYLSEAWGADVTEGGVLHLILSGRLVPSLFTTVSIKANITKIISYEQFQAATNCDSFRKTKGDNDKYYFITNEMIWVADGLYDFADCYSEFIKYRIRLTSGADRTLGINPSDKCGWSFILIRDNNVCCASYTPHSDSPFIEFNHIDTMDLIIRKRKLEEVVAEGHKATTAQSGRPDAGGSQEAHLVEVVRQLFWASPPPDGHNRPTKDLIVDWLMTAYGKKRLTKKAAGRIYTTSRPDNIPKHGNVTQSNKPYPAPPYPEE